MEIKTFPGFATKVIDADQGVVEGIITVFGILDSGNDIAHPGSFRKTLQERAAKIKVLDSHRIDSVMHIVGVPLEVREISRAELPAVILSEYPEATGGVYAKTQFLLDTPEGAGTFARIKAGALQEWSYGYDALDIEHSIVKNADGQDVRARHLKTIRLWEYSPVLWGMNPGTAVVSAKAAQEAKPWAVFPEDGQFVVYRVNDDGERTGDPVGTHETEDEANAHVRALYANEPDAGKDDPEDTSQEKDDKAGRVLSARNATRVGEALAALLAVLEDAGIDIPGFGKDDADDTDEKAHPERYPAILGKDFEGGMPRQRLSDVLQGSVHRIFTVLADEWYVEGWLSREERVQLSGLIGDALDVLTRGIPEDVASRPICSWGLMSAVLNMTEKADRPADGETAAGKDTAPDQAADSAPDRAANDDLNANQAGPDKAGVPSAEDASDDRPPTFNDLLAVIELELEELELLEV